ncbi:MAG: hypothetical protein ACD_3C00049G0014 [uncultured bacterium (gcode 4)]|uniref:Uncharacterized protein n=1 Tax=uncultured bacterium (gcode 4) TaxID=1234023 RepID=K2G2P3_9BACT|nr:MAG: hypothetical protein ACD_3C00049G0014 [uncultured bacterium (gcode 4)]
MPTIYSIRSAWMGEPWILSRKANDEAEYLWRSIKARERAKGETSIIISSSVPSCIQTAQAISKGFASEINNIVTPYLWSEEKNIWDIDRASKLITKYKWIHLFILVTEPEVLFKISEELWYIWWCSRLRFLEFIKFSTWESSSTESEKSKWPCEDWFDWRWFNLFS